MDINYLLSIISAIITIGSFIGASIKFFRKKRRLSLNQRKKNSEAPSPPSAPKFLNVKNLGIVASIFLALTLFFGIRYYFSQTPKNLAESATMLVHDLETGLKTSESIYIHPLTLFILDKEKTHLDVFDTALHDALSQSQWLNSLEPREKLGTADIFFLRQQAKCDNAKLASGQCNSLIADLIDADSELTGEVRINKKQVNVDITLTKVLTKKVLAHATISFPKSFLAQETLEQLNILPTKIHKGNLEIEMSTSHGVHNVTYHHDETLRLFIRSNQATYVYVFVFDAKNSSTLLYPESKQHEPKEQESGKLFVLPGKNLPYSLLVQEPFGKTTIWAIAVTIPLQFPEEMDDTWFQADTLRQQVRELGLASSTNYAETEIMVQTIGPSNSAESEDDLDLDSLLD